ncbi:hypothetical protein LZB65_03825 [Campylobacter lari]|nr:hypothetical protein [Campylobacter lari]
MKTFLQNIPKVELHLHIEGSLEPKMMFDLARKNNITLKYKSEEEIKKAYDFSNLQDFLDIYIIKVQMSYKPSKIFMI